MCCGPPKPLPSPSCPVPSSDIPSPPLDLSLPTWMKCVSVQLPLHILWSSPLHSIFAFLLIFVQPSFPINISSLVSLQRTWPKRIVLLYLDHYIRMINMSVQLPHSCIPTDYWTRTKENKGRGRLGAIRKIQGGNQRKDWNAEEGSWRWNWSERVSALAPQLRGRDEMLYSKLAAGSRPVEMDSWVIVLNML